MPCLIKDMATKYKLDKKLGDVEAEQELKEKLSGATAQMHGTTVKLLIYMPRPQFTKQSYKKFYSKFILKLE